MGVHLQASTGSVCSILRADDSGAEAGEARLEAEPVQGHGVEAVAESAREPLPSAACFIASKSLKEP